MQIGKQIKSIRETKKLSQQELANKLKYLNQSQIAKIESGNRKITAIDLVRFADALGVSVDEIVREKSTK